jgi:hypothetical protein
MGRGYPVRCARTPSAAARQSKTEAGDPMNPHQLAELIGVAAAVPRLPGAACRGLGEMADIEIRSSRTDIDAAIEICLGCTEMQRCRAWLDSLPAGHKPLGVVAGRLVDPAAYRSARAAMQDARKPPPQPAPPPRKGRLRTRLLAAAGTAGSRGLTVNEAAAALYGSEVTAPRVEQARQALERLVARGALQRVDRGQRGGRGAVARYSRADDCPAAAS